MSSAICMPSPVLNCVPRTFASSQPGPRYRVRISVFDSKPPHASTTAFVSISRKPSASRTFSPVMLPRLSVLSACAFVPYSTGTPLRSSISNSWSVSPCPAPTASTIRPPQKRNIPSCMNACLPYARIQRTPCSCIHFIAGYDCDTSTWASSGSDSPSVTRIRSS